MHLWHTPMQLVKRPFYPQFKHNKGEEKEEEIKKKEYQTLVRKTNQIELEIVSNYAKDNIRP